MASTRGLQPAFRRYADALLALAREYGPYRVTSGRRSRAEQVALYQRWLRCPTGPNTCGIFTPAPPGHSQHERGWAIDMAQPGVHPKSDEILADIGHWWRSVGGVWGGASDPVHFEAPKAWTGRA